MTKATAPVPKKLREVLSFMKDPTKQEPVEYHDLYLDTDPVVKLDDGSFLRSVKIRDSYWDKPGIIKVYAPWCPHCQSSVESIKKLASSLKKSTVYVLDGTVNPMFRFAHGVNAYPTFYKVLENGTVSDVSENLISWLKELEGKELALDVESILN
jgi:thiol-disulfide isomerase/thioredoxin